MLRFVLTLWYLSSHSFAFVPIKLDSLFFPHPCSSCGSRKKSPRQHLLLHSLYKSIQQPSRCSLAWLQVLYCRWQQLANRCQTVQVITEQCSLGGFASLQAAGEAPRLNGWVAAEQWRGCEKEEVGSLCSYEIRMHIFQYSEFRVLKWKLSVLFTLNLTQHETQRRKVASMRSQ